MSKARAAAAAAALLVLPWLPGAAHAGVPTPAPVRCPTALPETAAIVVPAEVTAPPGDFFTLAVDIRGMPPCPQLMAARPTLTVTYPAMWLLLTPDETGNRTLSADAIADTPANACVDAKGEGHSTVGTRDHIVPLNLSAKGAATVHFFTFHVPSHTPAGRYAISIHFTPLGKEHLSAEREASPRAEVTVRVPPHVRLAYEPLPAVKGYRAEPVTVPLRLRNDGNVALLASLFPRFPRGWAVANSESAVRRKKGDEESDAQLTVYIPARATVEVPVTAQVPARASFGDYPFHVDVHAAAVLEGAGGDAALEDGGAQRYREHDRGSDHVILARTSATVRVRGSVAVLPPDPSRVPRHSARAPAALHADWAGFVGPFPMGGGPGPSRIQAELETYFPGTPSAGRMRIMWESHTTPRGSSVRPLHVTDLDYTHPRGGWRLRRWTPSLEDTLLARPNPSLQWQSRGLGISVPWPAAATSFSTEPAPATVTWRPAPDALPIALSHRFRAPGTPAASEMTVAWSLSPKLFGRLHGAFASGEPGWGAHLSWSSLPGGPSSRALDRPRWRGEARGYILPSALAPAGTPMREAIATLERISPKATIGLSLWHGAVPVHVGAVSASSVTREQHFSLSVPLWKAGVRAAAPLGRIGSAPVHGQLEWARTAAGSPVPEQAAPLLAGPLAPRDDVYGTVRLGWDRHRLLARSRWYRQGPTRAWQHALSWRQSMGLWGWWQITAVRDGRRTDPPPSAPPTFPRHREGWTVGVQGGWRDGKGRRWTAGIRWAFPDDRTRLRTEWHAGVSLPPTSGWQWHAGIAGRDGGGGPQLDVGVGITYRFSLPWPGPNPALGYVEGRLHLPGTDGADPPNLAGAVLRLGPELVSTDEEGRFRFPPLPPGTYELTVEGLPPAVAAETAVPEPVSITVNAGETVAVETPLVPRGHIVGRLTPSPSPGEPALFHVRLVDEEGAVAAQRWVRGNQRFHFQRLAPGAYRLEVTAAVEAAVSGRTTGAGYRSFMWAEKGVAAAVTTVTAVLVTAGETTVVDITPPATEGAGTPPVTFQGEETWPAPHPAGAKSSQ